jgi:proteasome lid subunit RPN8/RPN11
MEITTIYAIREHAARVYPEECCGLVIVARGRERYVPCSNAAEDPMRHFRIPEAEFFAAESQGQVIALVHSHPDALPLPSQADLTMCEESQLPSHIISWPSGDIHTIEPSGYVAPLVGRTFTHGILDCWTLVRDWYRQERGIILKDADRPDKWWNDGKSDLYRDGFAERGGVVVPLGSPLEVGDVILMEVRSGNGVPNHAAVYLGGGHILHHMYGRLSTRDVYGGYWMECTRMVLRYAPK